MLKQLTRTSIVLCCLLLSLCVQAAVSPPTLPIPRIEVGAHIDRPVDIAFDSIGQQIISVSDDRTIRFWEQKSGRLLHTLRVPMTERKEGELYALAVAPQSRRLVVGGTTGYSWDKSLSLYVFDLDSLQMIQRVKGIHERPTALEFSKDEQRLAVALIDGTRLMYQTSNFTKIATNQRCRANSYRMHFSKDNRLAAQCFDQTISIYDDELNHLKTIVPWQGHQVSSVYWSPDSSQLLVSFYDEQRVIILDGATYELLQELDMTDIPNQVVPQATWSADGRYIYAAGDATNNGEKQLVQWDLLGSKKPKMFPIDQKRIFNLLPLPDGSIVYSSLAHAIGKVDELGGIAFHQAPPIVSHFGRDEFLSISPDASKVSFALNDEGTRSQTFSMVDRSLTVSEVSQGTPLTPLHHAPGMKIENWRYHSSPSYNGKSLNLYAHQKSNALAISPTHLFFALGLDSELRRYNKDGGLAWSKLTMAGVVAVNVSQDGKVIVAGLQDGSIRWYRADDGEEFFALFAHKNEQDWVAWVPPGFFMASPDGDKYIGWQLNNSADEAADFYSAWQFERLLYRPDIVEDYFDSQGVWSNSRQFEKFRTQRMRDLAPPKVELSLLGVTESGTAKIRIESTKRQLPIEQYTVFVNDLPVTPFNERELSDTERETFIREHEVPLNAVENDIRVEILTDSSFQVDSLYVESDTIYSAQQGDLYLLAIGVNELDFMPENNLNYAAQDAVSVASLLGKAESQFKQTHIKVLSDLIGEKPTKENILSSLSFLQQSGADDTVILYIAAHGISNNAGDYFMVPSDGKLDDLSGVIKDDQRNASSLVRWDSFFEGMRDAAGRRMLIVDTCEAQKIKGNFDFNSLAKRSSAGSFGLLSASTGNEQSQEYPPAEQGLFTYGLLQALQGQADNNQDSVVNLEEVYEFTKGFVSNNRLLEDLPQTPQLLASKALRTTALSDLTKKSSSSYFGRIISFFAEIISYFKELRVGRWLAI